MKADNNKTRNFIFELSSILNSTESYQNFRIRALKLIQKHYDYDKMIFIIYKDNYSYKNIESFLNNVTLGVSSKMATKYYEKYYFLDPLNDVKLDQSAVDVFDYISEEEFLRSEYYLDFMSEYNLYAQVIVGLYSNNQLVGSLSFYKNKEEGLFTVFEKKEIETIASLVSIELQKALLIKDLSLQNIIYKEHVDLFPIAQIVLNKDHDVIYYNKHAKKYIEELSGAHINFFKYFFINEILGNKLFTHQDENKVIDSDNFIMKITRVAHWPKDPDVGDELLYTIFVTKKITANSIAKNSNEYFDRLTDREKEISHLVQRGYTNDEIGQYLKISPYTVKTHIQRMYSKCDSNNRLDLIHKLFSEEK